MNPVIFLPFSVSGEVCPADSNEMFVTPVRASIDPDLWHEYSESVPSWVFPEQLIHLDPNAISTNTKTVIYSILDHPDWVIKYNYHCTMMETMPDGSLVETYFLEYVNGRVPGITNKLLYLSDPIVPVSRSKVKTPRLNKLTCNDGSPLSVRFFISERIAGDLRDTVLKQRALPFPVAIEYGIQIFKIIQQLHSIDVVHVDLHSGNIGFRRGTPELLLIDFGSAKFRPGISQLPPGDPKITCRDMYTPWESLGATYTTRDDAYRVALLMGFMMYGLDHLTGPMKACGGGYEPERLAQYMQFKSTQNIFDMELNVPKRKGGFLVFNYSLERILPEEYKEYSGDISAALNNVLTHLRGLAFEDTPDYDFIVKELKQVLAPGIIKIP